MKKGEEYIGVVVRTEFPNKGIVELEDCVSGKESLEDKIIRRETIAAVNHFLSSLSETERKIFLCRYWYLDSVKDIAERFGFSSNRTSVMLRRIRQKLNAHLAKEGLL